MDKCPLIFSNLECAVQVSGAEPAISLQEEIKRLRHLANRARKTKKPEAGKDAKAPGNGRPNNRVVFKYDLDRIGVNGVVAEVFGQRCRVFGDEGREVKMEITLSDDEFWPFVFSDQWSQYTGLRVLHGNVLCRLLVTLDRLAGSDGRLRAVSVFHYDADVAAAKRVANPNEAVPARIEFTFYAKKVASSAERLSEKRKSKEGFAAEPPSADGAIESQSPLDVQNPAARDHESLSDTTNGAVEHQGPSDFTHHITKDRGGPLDITDNAIIDQGLSDTENAVDEVQGEQADINPVAFNDVSPRKDVSYSAKDHKDRGEMAESPINALQEPVQNNTDQDAEDTSSVASSADEAPGGSAQPTLTTDGKTATKKKRIKSGKGRKTVSRLQKRKGQKKGDGATMPDGNEEDQLEMVYDSAVFVFDEVATRNDEDTKKDGKSSGKGSAGRAKPKIKAKAEPRTITKEVEDSIGADYMFERRSMHTRANFSSLEEYLSNRQQERKGDMCLQKGLLRGAVLITDTCVSARVSKTNAESEARRESETKEAEDNELVEGTSQMNSADQRVSLTKKDYPQINSADQRVSLTKKDYPQISSADQKVSLTKKDYPQISSADQKASLTKKDYPQINSADQKASLTKKDYPETEKVTRSSQSAEDKNRKSLEISTTYSELPQQGIDKEDIGYKDNKKMIKEGERTSCSDKSSDEQIENRIERVGSERKMERLIRHASGKDKSRRQGNRPQKETRVPTRVVIGQLGRSLTTWIINEPMNWRTTSKVLEQKHSRCDIEIRDSDFALATEFPAERKPGDDLTDEANKVDSATPAQLADRRSRGSAKQQSAKRSRTSSSYTRKSSGGLEELQQRSSKKPSIKPEKDQPAKVAKVKQMEGKKKKGKLKEKAQPPPTVKEERLRRSQINEWDVDEDFLSHLILALDRFEVRKECITVTSGRTQTSQFVTFTRHLQCTYC